MSDSEGSKELTGLARTVEALFSGVPVAPSGGEATDDVTLEATDDVTLEATDDVTLEATDDVTLEPTDDVTLEAMDDVTLEAMGGATADESDGEEHEPSGGASAESSPPVVDPGTPPPLPAADGPSRPDSSDSSHGATVPETGAEVAEHALLSVAGRAGDDGQPIEPTPLDSVVDAYLAGDRGRADEIERVAAEMLERRELDAIARSVARLAAAAGDPPDRDVLSLATSLGTPAVLSRLAEQMGLERDEARRRAYFRACRTLGEPMAVAIRNDLAESTDRLARRIHCDALVEMGPPGRAIIEEMVMDENRFLVRNAVAMLGELGGERAVELVTSALANPDARVRREALWSLAKLGDEDAGPLVLGLLEDPDQEVRIAAATAAGELRVGRALKRLVAMLNETKDPDEVLPVIRALGQLGDPGAVASIEKHAVRTMFSRPRTDVRITAYRALNQIDTPHARRLLNQAMDDKDPEVKAAVRKILNVR